MAQPTPLRASLPDQVDIVIVGAGIIGAACFFELTRADHSLNIACLEMEHKLHGSTARSAAAFRHQFAARTHIAMSLISGQIYDAFPQQFGCESVLKKNGYLFVYTNAQALEAAAGRAENQRNLGVPDVEVLSAEAVRERFPMIEHPELVGATFCRHDGFLLPDAVTNAYFEHGLAIGGNLKQYAPVCEIVHNAGRVRGVRVCTDSGTHLIRADTVINAAGPWANTVSQLAGLALPVTPVKRYLYFTNQFASRTVRNFPLCVFDLETYCRPEANALMLGWDKLPKPPAGVKHFPPPQITAQEIDSDTIDEGFGKGHDDYGFDVLSTMAEYMPVLLDEAGLEAVSAGYYAVTPDHKAIIDWDPRLAGLLHVNGFSGHGVMHAPAAGQLACALALGSQPPFDAAPLALAPLLANAARPDPEHMII